jgi:dipeptidyl aminopeptidase/acylaminoacyl peptidase
MYPNVKMQKFEERECITLENQGQKIFGMLHLPLQSAPRAPAVLMCHGFAGNKLGRYRIYVLLAQALAQVGIATLRIDFRGSGESEGDFSDMTIEGEVSDTLKGLEFLRNHSKIEASRIGLLGNSFGGAIAVISAYQDAHIRSLALLAPLFYSLPWRQHWEKVMAGSGDLQSEKEIARILDGNTLGPAFYKSFLQLTLEKELAALQHVPLLHVHSDKDERVGLDQAEQYRRCRENAVAQTKWIRLEKSDHDFCLKGERKQVIDETVAWFHQTL